MKTKIDLFVKLNDYPLKAEIDTYEEHQKRKERDFEMVKEDSYLLMQFGFEDYLKENFSLVSLFFATEEEKKETLENFKNFFKEDYDENDGWKKITKEIE